MDKIILATIIQRRYVIYDFSFSNNKHFCVTWLMIFLVPPVFFIFWGYFVFVIISSAYWNFQFLIFSNIMGLSLEEMLKNLWIGQTSIFVYLLLLSLSSYNTIFGRITSKHGWGKNNSRIPLRFQVFSASGRECTFLRWRTMCKMPDFSHYVKIEFLMPVVSVNGVL